MEGSCNPPTLEGGWELRPGTIRTLPGLKNPKAGGGGVLEGHGGQ